MASKPFEAGPEMQTLGSVWLGSESQFEDSGSGGVRDSVPCDAAPSREEWGFTTDPDQEASGQGSAHTADLVPAEPPVGSVSCQSPF